MKSLILLLAVALPSSFALADTAPEVVHFKSAFFVSVMTCKTDDQGNRKCTGDQPEVKWQDASVELKPEDGDPTTFSGEYTANVSLDGHAFVAVVDVVKFTDAGQTGYSFTSAIATLKSVDAPNEFDMALGGLAIVSQPEELNALLYMGHTLDVGDREYSPILVIASTTSKFVTPKLMGSITGGELK